MKVSLSNKQLSNVKTYNEWLSLHESTKQSDYASSRYNSSRYDNFESSRSLLTNHTERLANLINHSRLVELSRFLDESLHQMVGELNNVRLHQFCNSEVEAYLDTVTEGIELLAKTALPNMTQDDKLKRFSQVEKNFGRPALMLSGGGTFGIAHIGVVKSLFDQHLLPDIVSGTSMGSIAAGIIATHTDEELTELFNTPENAHYQPLKPLPLTQKIKQGAWMDETQLKTCIESNIKPYTFAEAYQKTGRSVSITVSPTRPGQKPRILNHLTAPDVLITTASKASCSVPGLFPPASLKARRSGTHEGTNEAEQDYLPTETWCDGAIASDIPRQRISRLFNVNYFIVSQANPHILPFVSQRQKPGIVALIKDVAISSLVSQGNAMIKLAQRRITRQPFNASLSYAELLLDQDYLGDITIHPKFPIGWYKKFMINPNEKELNYLILKGEQATWPHLQMIRNQTRISNTLRACIEEMKGG
ncbi:patatin-like phospholipase family protein [Litoribrevibacter euphylliae]|uniref:Patatin-like phospholipase family protein n=1 Tax=Litoribrevibacter euphylliae TaxID=1834034 RepID=A0ABV7HJ98_9GAMM